MECRMARRTAMLPSAHAAISRRPTTASTTLMCNCVASHLMLGTVIEHNIRTHAQACKGLLSKFASDLLLFLIGNMGVLAERLDND